MKEAEGGIDGSEKRRRRRRRGGRERKKIQTHTRRHTEQKKKTLSDIKRRLSEDNQGVEKRLTGLLRSTQDKVTGKSLVAHNRNWILGELKGGKGVEKDGGNSRSGNKNPHHQSQTVEVERGADWDGCREKKWSDELVWGSSVLGCVSSR